MCAPFMHNEFLDDDVNKFAHLSGSGVPVALSPMPPSGRCCSHDATATYIARMASPGTPGPAERRQELLGIPHVAAGSRAPDYSLDDVAVIERMVEPLAVTFRIHSGGRATPGPGSPNPRTITVDLAGRSCVSDRAKDALDLICAAPVHSVAASTLAHSRGRPRRSRRRGSAAPTARGSPSAATPCATRRGGRAMPASSSSRPRRPTSQR